MCGIVGVFGNKKAAELATLGLFAEQHRGQESCGLAVSNGSYIKLHKKMGLVKDVFTPEVMEDLQGEIAIGHVRYPTCGSSSEYNSQPHLVETLYGPVFSLASNGDITNYTELREFLETKGVFFHSYNDGELIIRYIVYKLVYKKQTIVAAIRDLMHAIKGAYSTVFMMQNEMFVFRDPNGIRPLSIARLKDGSYVAASESCALDLLGVEWKREVKPAEIIRLSDNGMEVYENDARNYRANGNAHHCSFEHIYFSRPDSFEFGQNVYEVRKRIGAELADHDKITPDLVVPVPDSANFIALGYAHRKKIPYEMGLIRNHYVGRTFIKPDQTIRDESVYQKFNPLPNFFQDKKVVLVDDSIVRGTTLRKIVKLVRSKGASEIHLRIGSPPVRYSCFYGIDTPTQSELIAYKKTHREIVEYLGVDSLMYMDLEMIRSVVPDPENHCYACFTGEYPVELDKEVMKTIDKKEWDFEQQR
jgi:amidophosphoribosyltransferase